MKTLVTVASKHGSTQEIAYFIGKTMKQRGVETDVKNIDDVDDLSGYQAVVLGSAVYAGSWLKKARDFVKDHEKELSAREVWLFSSGPIGGVPAREKAVKVDNLLAATKAQEHHLFAGKVDKSHLNFAQKAMLYAVGAEQGDYRDWNEIESWAADIANSIKLNGGRTRIINHSKEGHHGKK